MNMPIFMIVVLVLLVLISAIVAWCQASRMYKKLSPKYEPFKIVTPDPVPVVGEIWILQDDSPWGSKFDPVKILDVKEGWVRYYINDVFDDNRRELKSFVRIYQRVY